MYPSISNFGSQRHEQGQGQGRSQTQPGPPSWPPSQLLDFSGESQNGPAGSNSVPPASASNFPMLRVHVADHLRTSPPVMINAALEDIPRAQFSYNFDYEHQLISRLDAEQPTATPDARTTDPFEAAIDRFSGDTFLREEIAMAIAAIGPSNPDELEVKQFCKNFRELKSMGFDVPSVVGALLLHKTDLAAATDACLSAQ